MGSRDHVQWETRPETSILKNDIMGFTGFGENLGIIP